jgi:hypothetical protein
MGIKFRYRYILPHLPHIGGRADRSSVLAGLTFFDDSCITRSRSPDSWIESQIFVQLELFKMSTPQNRSTENFWLSPELRSSLLATSLIVAVTEFQIELFSTIALQRSPQLKFDEVVELTLQLSIGSQFS